MGLGNNSQKRQLQNSVIDSIAPVVFEYQYKISRRRTYKPGARL